MAAPDRLLAWTLKRLREIGKRDRKGRKGEALIYLQIVFEMYEGGV